MKKRDLYVSRLARALFELESTYRTIQELANLKEDAEIIRITVTLQEQHIRLQYRLKYYQSAKVPPRRAMPRIKITTPRK